MNFSFWNFLRNLRTEKKQFAVIGLGRFGSAVCSTLHKSGYEVLAVDKEEKRVTSLKWQGMANKIIYCFINTIKYKKTKKSTK